MTRLLETDYRADGAPASELETSRTGRRSRDVTGAMLVGLGSALLILAAFLTALPLGVATLGALCLSLGLGLGYEQAVAADDRRPPTP